MIYGLTGDSKGFGRYIKARLIADGHSVIGFSRTNGYDLRYDIDRIVDQSNACDVFINNACIGDVQPRLLAALYDRYRFSEKLILNIGSWITDVDLSNDSEHYFSEQMVKLTLRNMVNELGLTDTTLRIIYKTWGFHTGHPLLDRFPHLKDETTIDQAVLELIGYRLS